LAQGALAVAGATAVLLIATAGRYGFHRDELYFLAAGDRLDWGYPDQGPLVPLLARLMDTIAPGSLVALRTPSALATGATVLLAALVARELGGRAGAQTLAAAATATAGFVLGTGHLFSTTTYDLLAWTALGWLAIRAVRRGDDRLWLVAGVVAGLALLVKPLMSSLLVALAIGVLVSGPRRLLRSPWVWAGAALAVAIASPTLVWQAANGWPQVEMAQAIADGSSGSSEPRWAIVPMQFLLVSPVLAPVWIAGLVRLFRDPAVRDVRFVATTYVAIAVIFLVTGGKPYYLTQLAPVLLGVGAQPVVDWARTTARRTALGAAVAVSAVVSSVIALPVLPADRLGPVLAVNYDSGETVGWPELAAQVRAVVRELPPAQRRDVIVLTGNYGEAGAVERFAPGLAPAYSGHNAFGYWGPPPAAAQPVVVVGWQDLDGRLTGCTTVATIDNGRDLDNEEQGAPVRLCDGPTSSWRAVWPDIRRLG
jgi:4-amino-4-deoxy-L-arabinose transferase-like glycosyltransferase